MGWFFEDLITEPPCSSLVWRDKLERPHQTLRPRGGDSPKQGTGAGSLGPGRESQSSSSCPLGLLDTASLPLAQCGAGGGTSSLLSSTPRSTEDRKELGETGMCVWGGG